MKNLITCFFIVLLSSSTYACTFDIDAFCHTINNRTPENTILRGMFVETEDNGLIFQRLETLRGDEDREFIKIWDNSTFDCNGPFERKAINMGQIGVEKIMSFESIDSIIQSYDVIGDYRVPEGLWWETHTLLVEDNNVTGLIWYGDHWEGHSTVDYDLFKSKMIEEGTCVITSTHESKVQNIEISPSLTNGSIYLRYDIIDNGEILHIFNNVGQEVMQKKLTQHIDLTGLKSGLYFIIITNKAGSSAPTKIVKI